MSDLRGVVAAAHDLSEGGLSQALIEFAAQSGVGIAVDPTAALDPTAVTEDAVADTFTALFSETASRVLLAVPTDRLEDAEAVLGSHGVPTARIGTTTAVEDEATAITVTTVGAEFSLPCGEAKQAWEATLPGLFSHAAGANSIVD